MTAVLQEIEVQALTLPPEERTELIHRLIISLDGETKASPDEIAKAWDAEIARRVGFPTASFIGMTKNAVHHCHCTSTSTAGILEKSRVNAAPPNVFQAFVALSKHRIEAGQSRTLFLPRQQQQSENFPTRP